MSKTIFLNPQLNAHRKKKNCLGNEKGLFMFCRWEKGKWFPAQRRFSLLKSFLFSCGFSFSLSLSSVKSFNWNMNRKRNELFWRQWSGMGEKMMWGEFLMKLEEWFLQKKGLKGYLAIMKLYIQWILIKKHVKWI